MTPNEMVLCTSLMIVPTLSGIGIGRIEPHGYVAAADIEANARNADLLLIGDHAVDRLRIADFSPLVDFQSSLFLAVLAPIASDCWQCVGGRQVGSHLQPCLALRAIHRWHSVYSVHSCTLRELS